MPPHRGRLVPHASRDFVTLKDHYPRNPVEKPPIPPEVSKPGPSKPLAERGQGYQTYVITNAACRFFLRYLV